MTNADGGIWFGLIEAFGGLLGQAAPTGICGWGVSGTPRVAKMQRPETRTCIANGCRRAKGPV